MALPYTPSFKLKRWVPSQTSLWQALRVRSALLMNCLLNAEPLPLWPSSPPAPKHRSALDSHQPPVQVSIYPSLLTASRPLALKGPSGLRANIVPTQPCNSFPSSSGPRQASLRTFRSLALAGVFQPRAMLAPSSPGHSGHAPFFQSQAVTLQVPSDHMALDRIPPFISLP